nr:ATP-binding cassette domain-containing protein [uncultured Cohaesibacter sp.]
MQEHNGHRAMILDQVRIHLESRRLIDLSLTVDPGEIVTVMGPSGSGKSTLLAYLSGFLDPAFRASGRLTLCGQDVTALPAQRRQIGILFQDPLLFPHLSVGGNLAFGLSPSVKGREMRKAAIRQALDAINMVGFEGRDPATLSGGQKARVALARTLLSQPRALLLDEPFSKLDADLRQHMRQHVFGRARAQGLPTLLVTHDEEDAKAAGGPIIRLAAQG